MRKQRLEHLSMMLKAGAFAVIAGMALSGSALGQEGESGELGIGDPVLEKLLKNIEKFKAGLEAVRSPVFDELEKRREEARKTGVLRKLEEATQDVEAFDKSDKLPATLMATKPELMKQFRKGKEQVQQQMIRDHEAAIQAYTHEDKVAEAAVIREKLEEFKASLRTPPSKQQPRRRRRR